MADVGTATQGAVDAGEQVRSAIYTWLTGIIGDGITARTISNFFGAVIGALPAMVMWAFGSVFQVAAALVAVFLDGVTSVRQQSQASINEVIAAALTDIMGVQISASQLPSTFGSGGNIVEFQAIGRTVLSAMTQELGGSPASSPGPGELGAQRFLGRGLSFSVNAAMLSVVAELSSLGFIKEFKEVGEEIQANIGFGRLMRQALHPLINSLITLPYTRETNATYRPHQLSLGEYMTAFNAGRLDDTTTSTQLSQLGFSDAYIAELKLQHAPKLAVHQVDALIRWGKVTADQGLAMLVAQGWPQAHAQNELDSLHLAEADKQEQAYAGEILGLAKQRQIDSPTFSTLLQRLHLSAEAQQGYLNRLGVYLDSNTKRLSLGEMLYLSEKSLLTLDQMDTWIASEGYNADTAAMLELYVTSKELDYQQAQQIKVDKAKAAAAAAKAKGNPPPPSIINP
jgi:hypothetical protein